VRGGREVNVGEECNDMRCRRVGIIDSEGNSKSVCAGYHCGRCGEPSSQYGHYSWDLKDFTCKP